MLTKSAVAALILVVVLLVFSVLSFTIWRDVPHIIYMKAIVTTATCVSLIVLFARHCDWRKTPDVLNPIKIWKRVANWNIFDSAKMTLATVGNEDKRMRQNIELIKQYPFNIDNCNATLVDAYHKGHNSSEYVPNNIDEVRLAKIMKLAIQYDPYKVSHKLIEQVINDTCHNGVNVNAQCWNVLKHLSKVTELNNIKDIYTLIDCITNFNPVAANKSHIKLTDNEHVLIQHLWSLTRDPNHYINLNVSDLSTTALLKFYDQLDLLDRVLLKSNPILLNNLKDAIKAISDFRQSVLGKLPLFMGTSDRFVPSYSISYDNTKPQATVYKTTQMIKGSGKLSDPELASVDLTTDINKIFYDNDNVHYDMNLIRAVGDVEVDKQSLLSNPHLNPVLKSFIGLFKQKTN